MRAATDPQAAPAPVPVIAYDESLPIVRRYWRCVFGHTPPPTTPAVLVADLRAIAAGCAAGSGYSVLRYLVRDQLAGGQLVALHEPPAPDQHLLPAWRSSATIHAAVAAVRSRLRAAAPEW